MATLTLIKFYWKNTIEITNWRFQVAWLNSSTYFVWLWWCCDCILWCDVMMTQSCQQFRVIATNTEFVVINLIWHSNWSPALNAASPSKWKSNECAWLHFVVNIWDLILLDFSKAFDHAPAWHIRRQTRNWIGSFLYNLAWNVFVYGALSDKASVTSGVPQGSLPGPVLFLWYINDSWHFWHLFQHANLNWWLLYTVKLCLKMNTVL